MTNLFTPLLLGRHLLANRIVMAPMTRSRADDEGIIGPLTATYYAQRAQAGLIVTEGIFPSWMGKGYVRTPGLVDARHVDAWRRVTDAVHDRGGRIFAQLMHSGRISDPSFLPNAAVPVAPSAVRPNGSSFTDSGMLPHVTPRALETPEVIATIADHRRSAELAIEAGFDGVEMHNASGYLAEQFVSSSTNLRTDIYGGSLDNRLRFTLETVDALVSAVGADRVGIKIAPELGFNDISDANPRETYARLASELAPRRIAYLHVVAPAGTEYHAVLRAAFGGVYLAGGGFDRERGEAMVASGGADAIVYGAPFIANPDLPRRFRAGAALAAPDKATFYAGGASGYVDYPQMGDAFSARGRCSHRRPAPASGAP